MRAFTSGSGSNTTNTVQSYLAAHRQLLVADLFELKTLVQGAPWSQDLLLTTFATPLTWNQKGTFVPARLKRGAVDSKIGFDASALDLEWSLRPTDMFYGSCSMLAAFLAGLWDNGVVTLYRAIMPALGDCNTLGACVMFTGRIADVTASRLGVQMKINCPLELLDQKMPPNLIEPGNPAAQYMSGVAPAGMGSVPVFSAGGSSTTQIVVAECTAPNVAQLFQNDTFDFGYIEFTSGACQGMRASVQFSEVKDGLNWFYLYNPLPWPPNAGDTFNGLVPYARGLVAHGQQIGWIPNANPCEISVIYSSEFVEDEGVVWASGGALTNVGPPNAQGSGGPSASGQYGCNGSGTYYFYSGDAGKEVLINYEYLNEAGAFQGFPYVPAPEMTV
jgi:hypothetical protein